MTGGAAVSPGSAAIRSLFVPGLGQFATGKPVAGVAFLGAWGGALAYGLLSKETTTECLRQVQPGGTCPSDDIRGTSVKRPSLAIGVGAALAVAVVSALHARSSASQLALGADRGARLALEPVLPGPEGKLAGLQFRIRF
jgi:hypothetical protein